MGTLKTSIAEKQIAEGMSNRLIKTVGVCKKNSETLVKNLQEAMKIDKIRNDRIELVQNTFLDVAIAAAFCLPGGRVVSSALGLFRQKTLSAAMKLAQVSEDSSIGESLLGKDEKSWQAKATGSLSNLLKGIPGKESSALSRICFDDVAQAASESIDELPDDDKGASRMASYYKQTLGQLTEVALGGEAAVLSSALATIAETVTLSQNGVQIALKGGFKIKVDGKVRMALGDDEVKAAKQNSEYQEFNRLQQGWSDREKVGITDFEKAQRKLSPDVRNSYPGDWSPEQVDAILAFKTSITAYRKKHEEVLAKMCMAEVTKHIIQDVVGGESALIKKGFEIRSTARHALYDGNHGALRWGVRLFSFGQAWSTTKDGDQRAELILDAYILHKILELHLGTPWLAPIPNHNHTRRKVAFALHDAWGTIVLSKVNRSSTSNLNKCYPAADLFASPLIASYWSPIGAFMGERERKNTEGDSSSRSSSYREFIKNSQVLDSKTQSQVVMDASSKVNVVLNSVDRAAQIKLYQSIPKISDVGVCLKSVFDPTSTYEHVVNVALNSDKLKEFLIDSINRRYDEISGKGGKGKEDLEDSILKLRVTLDSIADISWLGKKGDGDENADDKDGNLDPLERYKTWTKSRHERGLFETPENHQAADDAIKKYEVYSNAIVASAKANGNKADNLISAYLAQKMGMELLIAGVIEPTEVMKLMDDTIRNLLRLVDPEQFNRYKNFYKKGEVAEVNSVTEVQQSPVRQSDYIFDVDRSERPKRNLPPRGLKMRK